MRYVEKTTVRAEITPPTSFPDATPEHGHPPGHHREPARAAANAAADGLEWLTLHSAGLDVGSATSHLTISRVLLRRRGEELSNQWVVVEWTELYRSGVALTPYRTDTRIDADWLEGLFDDAYRGEGYRWINGQRGPGVAYWYGRLFPDLLAWERLDSNDDRGAGSKPFAFSSPGPT
ncbi:MAG: ethanolamine utilization protein EutA [Mycobacterium sp.]|jgi:hypothetical protein|nr:ethanolamine utilization protein EutA [Mycobacterium sp.]